MAAIHIGIRGQGNVPDSAVPEIRARVQALVQACVDAGAEGLLRVDFLPAEDPIIPVEDHPVTTAAPEPAAPSPPPEPVAAPTAPDVPFEAAVLERPRPQGRAGMPPREPKPPAATPTDAAAPVDKEDA